MKLSLTVTAFKGDAVLFHKVYDHVTAIIPSSFGLSIHCGFGEPSSDIVLSSHCSYLLEVFPDE